jgi:hypothetical protein
MTSSPWGVKIVNRYSIVAGCSNNTIIALPETIILAALFPPFPFRLPPFFPILFEYGKMTSLEFHQKTTAFQGV